jgi:hypothetical protein
MLSLRPSAHGFASYKSNNEATREYRTTIHFLESVVQQMWGLHVAEQRKVQQPYACGLRLYVIFTAMLDGS